MWDALFCRWIFLSNLSTTPDMSLFIKIDFVLAETVNEGKPLCQYIQFIYVDANQQSNAYVKNSHDTEIRRYVCVSVVISEHER